MQDKINIDEDINILNVLAVFIKATTKRLDELSQAGEHIVKAVEMQQEQILFILKTLREKQ